ncbi:hypothetical protein [Pseudoxanthomonas putridarboris]|uniref:Uncharacterized protein n=1 Tax=Pseudoxanthomonas putridarboris TaxID=752605 RepID=A0ABU9J1K9_9GAMM
MCRVSWNAVSGATYYEVLENEALAQSAGVTVYIVDMACGATYKVRACNAQVCSGWTAGVSN